MRIVIFDTYYPEALKLVYQNDPGLDDRSYAEQIRAVYELGFARADFLPLNLRKLGYEAEQFIANAEPLQRRWALEHGLRLSQSSNDGPIKKLWNRGYQSLKWRVGLTPHGEVEKWHMEAAAAQVKAFDPDVIFVCNVLHLPAEFFATLKDSGRRLLVGEIAYPIPAELNLRPYDLLVSAAPNFVCRLRQAGAKAEFLPLAFEPSVLKRLNSEPKAEGLVFIGNISGHHQERIKLLEEVSRHAPLSCYGAGVESLAPDSPLRGLVQPPIWGYEMYRKLQQSQIALNIHIDIAEKYAANMRLYEATGVGTMLLTDWKENLKDLFDVGQEVVTYRTPEECAELASYYLNHQSEREAIAAAGHRRTLRDHTYLNRMQDLVELFSRYLA